MGNGKHLTIDAYGCRNINNQAKIRKMLIDIPKLIKMNILKGPIVCRGADHLPGVTGIVIIETSHISIHTFTQLEKVHMDVFSCNDFNEKIVMDYIKNKFLTKKMNTTIIRR